MIIKSVELLSVYTSGTCISVFSSLERVAILERWGQKCLPDCTLPMSGVKLYPQLPLCHYPYFTNIYPIKKKLWNSNSGQVNIWLEVGQF